MNTKAQIAELIEEGEAFEKRINTSEKAPAPAGRLYLTSDLPNDFIQALRSVAATLDLGEFPNIERAIADPGDPEISHVLDDLRRARQAVAG